MKTLYLYLPFFFVALIGMVRDTWAADLPFGFEQTLYVDGLWDPNAMEFAPDGRLFIGERITGRVRIAKDGELLPEPFVTVPVPPEIPGRREEAADPGFRYSGIYHYGNYRSSGLEGIAFDPDFRNNGHVYLYFMNDRPRVNRVVRVTASRGNPNLADADSMEVLIDIPMHTRETDGPVQDGGSHNGGALLFGPDDKLYITVGDGWNPAPRDAPQDLSLLIGKVLRINRDGSVPKDNPFVDVPGARPEIWALGFRNPYTAAVHPESGRISINDVVWGKETVYELVKGGNYQHPSYGGDGKQQHPVHSGVGLIAGGTWYVAHAFPEPYHGSFFITDWRGGAVRRMVSEDNAEVVAFATGTHQAGQIRTGPDGALYWLSTTYETMNGKVYRIHFRPDADLAAPPRFSPSGGEFDEPVNVRMESATEEAEIRYSMDSSEPVPTSPLYREPLLLHSTVTVKARAFAPNHHPSATTSAKFESDLPPSLLTAPELAGRWPLDDGRGNLARDVSGQSRHISLKAAAWKRSADEEIVLNLDGEQGYGDLGTWDLETPAFSISAWIRPEAFPGEGDNRILSKATGDPEQAHYWMLSTFRNNGIHLRFRLKTHDRTSTLIASSGELSAGVWSHVAATYDGMAMRLFVNGEEVGSMPKSGPPDRHPQAPIHLGANPRSNPPRLFAGSMREVHLHNYALMEDDLLNLLEQTHPRRDEDALERREAAFAVHEPALRLAGNKEAGREIFMERCMACHRYNGVGQPIGPDLDPLTDRDRLWLLSAILDPGAEIPPEYRLYRVTTLDNETIEGIIAEETPETLTLRPLFGDNRVLERSRIQTFTRVERSAMPDGLANGLTSVQMASLLHFLQNRD